MKNFSMDLYRFGNGNDPISLSTSGSFFPCADSKRPASLHHDPNGDRPSFSFFLFFFTNPQTEKEREERDDSTDLTPAYHW